MLLDNEFLSPQTPYQPQINHQPPQSYPNSQSIAEKYAQGSLASVLQLVERGLCCISQESKKIQDLMDKPQRSQSELQRQEKRQKKQQRALKNSLLYSHNKNKQIQTQHPQHYGVLSNTQHSKFINQMKHQNSLRKINRQKQLQQKEQQLQTQLSTQRQLSQASRLLQLQKKKQAIKESLKKMRQNHEFFMRQEQESKKIFNKIKRKKRLYEQMKESYEEIAFELINEKEQKAKRDRQQLNKLDLSEINMHQKEYHDWKKKQLKERQRQSNQLVEVPLLYQPPAHSQKITQFLHEQIKNKNRVQISKRAATEKLHRIAQYTSVIRDKFKPKSPPARTQPTEKDPSAGSQTTQNKKSHTQLGNEYLKQAKLKIRQRAKTQERSLNPQTSRSRHNKDKSRTTTLNYIPVTKRKQHIQKMKRAQIENILKGGCASEAQRLRKLKLADQRLSRELRKKEEEMKIRYSTETSENTLALLLGTIRAKINLIDSYKPRNCS